MRRGTRRGWAPAAHDPVLSVSKEISVLATKRCHAWRGFLRRVAPARETKMRKSQLSSVGRSYVHRHSLTLSTISLCRLDHRTTDRLHLHYHHRDIRPNVLTSEGNRPASSLSSPSSSISLLPSNGMRAIVAAMLYSAVHAHWHAPNKSPPFLKIWQTARYCTIISFYKENYYFC